MLVPKIAVNDTADIGNGASVEILAANPRRLAAVITNGGANAIWISLGAVAVAGTGIYLAAAGGSVELQGENLWRGSVNGIAAAGASNIVGVVELQ
jgi:hypothetical protein